VRALSWVLRIALALLFLGSGGMKLAAAPEAVEAFAKLGWGQGFRVFVGVAEVLGAIGLVLTPLAPLAAVALAALMVGAVASHLLVLGPSPLPALVVLALCLVVAWLERSGFAALRVLLTNKGPMDGWIARVYDRGIQAAFRDLLPTLVGDLLTDIAGARRVLDAGCGPGQFTIMIAERLPEAEVHGIDLAPAMIELARAHARESTAASRLTFQIADVARLPYPDGHFDVVLSSGSMKHWPDAVAGLRELHRVLRPGGRAYVAEMNRTAPAEGVAAQAARARSLVMRRLYPRALAHALAPDEGRAAIAASPFGPPVAQRLLLDGCIWLFEARKAC
jgi:ubiquinone/menaquinone biosynthesis C-methylase UbiE